MSKSKTAVKVQSAVIALLSEKEFNVLSVGKKTLTLDGTKNRHIVKMKVVDTAAMLEASAENIMVKDVSLIEKGDTIKFTAKGLGKVYPKVESLGNNGGTGRATPAKPNRSYNPV